MLNLLFIYSHKSLKLLDLENIILLHDILFFSIVYTDFFLNKYN